MWALIVKDLQMCKANNSFQQLLYSAKHWVPATTPQVLYQTVLDACFPRVSQDTPWRSQRSYHRFGMRGEGIFNGTAQFWYSISTLLLQSQAKLIEAASHHWCPPFLFLFTLLFWTQEHTKGSCLRSYCCLDNVIGGILMWISAEKTSS